MLNRAGFFLIEIMIALAVLSGIAGVAATYQWQAVRAYQDSYLRLRALNAAREALESILSLGCMPAQCFNEVDGIAVTCRVAQAAPRLEGSLGAPGAFVTKPSNLACVEVTATWESLSGVVCSCRLLSVVRLDGGTGSAHVY